MALWRRRGFASSGKVKLYVGDAAFDDWPIVSDFEQLEVAMAFCQQLREAGFAAEITSDWQLDDFGNGDIALRVHPEEDQWAARDLIEFAEDEDD
ncbi:MAG: hypothetical protein HZB14_10310 [Actinobacteria bacterium]|nr:hypothetical protein [Actinomycetota bacterium]